MPYRRYLTVILLAALATLPGMYLRFSGYVGRVLSPEEPGKALAHAMPLSQVLLVTLLAGLAILGASFLLLWACDAVQEDISQTLALAIVALIAVLPEYAVDMYFTWQAGKNPGGEYAHYSIANMTGANRLIIGVFWLVIVGIYWFRSRRAVRIEKDRRTELFFLGVASLYACVVALKGALAWYDGLAFIVIYVWYIRVAGRRPVEESGAEGPAELLVNLPRVQRRFATIGLFLFAALAITANAQPFADGLISTGTAFHIKPFLLVQWLAPIASEAPELCVAIVFAYRLRAGLALGSLLSSNLNQWTLLVGMIPWVFAWSHGTLQHPIPMQSVQMNEIMLTAAQSILGIVLLASMRLSIGQALLIFGLFAAQLIMPEIIIQHPHLAPFGLRESQIHPLFSLIYLAIAIGLYLDHPRRLNGLWQGAKVEKAEILPEMAQPFEVESDT